MRKVLDKKDFPEWLNKILSSRGINVKTVTAKIGENHSNIGQPVYDYQSVTVIAYNDVTKESVAQRGCVYDTYVNATKEERAVYNGLTVNLTPSQFIVEINRTDRTWVTVYAHPDSITKSLEEEVKLSKAELVVLVATRSLKSSYAGISNYRFHEAQRQLGITLDQWERAKSSCISKGLLNARGAITTAGKNAVPHEKYSGLYSMKG